MISSPLHLHLFKLPVALACVLLVASLLPAGAQPSGPGPGHNYFMDCSRTTNGDGSAAHPWNRLASAETHPLVAGDRVALARGTVCEGSFRPQGSGSAAQPIRLTAYGRGARPRIVSPANARQALLLFNQEHWQIDSLDIAGGNTYGVFVTGDKGWMHGISLRNLYVHDVQGGKFTNKDNGLVVVGPSSASAFFDGVLLDGVDAARTNQWAGILAGGGPYNFAADAPLNRNIHIRNSTIHDVFGDGIVLFRDQDSSITQSAAWQTGMQPTQDTGTPNAIWTWTCTRCTVADTEAFLTDSPGVDGGAYDIDWDNHDNIVERNYGHETQGYCIAIFAAGYITTNSVVRNNLCIGNGMSPRLAASCGALCIFTWNEGVLKNVRIEGNRIQWDPAAPGTPAIASDAKVEGEPIVFANNDVESRSSFLARLHGGWTASENIYRATPQSIFRVAGQPDHTLAELQANGMESGSLLASQSTPASAGPLHLDAFIDPRLDQDGLLAEEPRAQLVVLRTLASQYADSRLSVIVHLPKHAASEAEANAFLDLLAASPADLHFVRDAQPAELGALRLRKRDGAILEQWRGVQNAATLGGAVRKRIGAPDFAPLQTVVATGVRE